jgi:alpha-beta hydrolase superfamily lysophospholipase
MRFAARLAQQIITAVLAIAVTILLVRAFDARNFLPLQLWHTVSLEAEVDADAIEAMDLDAYLAQEAKLFAEFEAEVEQAIPAAARLRLNRYNPEGQASPRRFAGDWNQSFEVQPSRAAEPRGGVLLIHGLTDSPYSMRHLAETYAAEGFYALVLRMPGHGTVPAALKTTQWEDWTAAVTLGARHVQTKTGADKPVHFVGYSNGGALVLDEALQALDDETLVRPAKIILISPMIGVTPVSRLARAHLLLSGFEYFEQFAWGEVVPEFDAFKYNSFPKEAGFQSFRLTMMLQGRLAALGRAGRLDELAPILTFQSLVDATVSTRDIVTHLYQRLGDDDELVLFDVNRHSETQAFMRPRNQAILDGLTGAPTLPFALTLVTNVSPEVDLVEERSRGAGPGQPATRPLSGEWPGGVYSLSHVALPFPATDEFYGSQPDPDRFVLGAVSPRGERDVLRMRVAQLMRIRHNPFFDYMRDRVVGVINEPAETDI